MSGGNELPPPRRSVILAAAVAVGTALYVVSCAIGDSYGLAFFSIPVFMGMVVGALAPVRPYRMSFVALAIALMIGIVTLREGVVCVVFSMPVLVPMLVLGAFAGSVLRRHVRTRRARDASIGLILLFGVGAQGWDAATDDPRSHPVHVAESSRLIAAPPQRVFAVLTERELRVAQRWPWFIRIGLPMPEAMIVDRPGLGGLVRFELAHMTVFARITAWNAPRELRYAIERYSMRDLPFHITRLGRAPDYGLRDERVTDWLTVLDTRYTVEPAPNGASRLRRRVVWRRHLAPDLYFGWLQQTVLEHGQARLLDLIAERVESASPRTPGDCDLTTSPLCSRSAHRAAPAQAESLPAEDVTSARSVSGWREAVRLIGKDSRQTEPLSTP